MGVNRVFDRWLPLVNQSVVHIAILVVATLFISTKDITVGDFRHPDSWSHAMNGVYLLDLAKEMPLGRFWDFTLNYYAKYPAITLPYHPPGFPLVEAILFALFGISAIVARFAAVICAIVAVVSWYKLVRATHNSTLALVSGLLIISNSAVAAMSRQVMLEVPALAVMVLSVYFLHKAVESSSRANLYWWAISASASVWFKQTTAFVLPMSITYFLLRMRRFQQSFKSILLSIGIIFVLLIPIAYVTWHFARFAVVQVVASTQYSGFEKLSAANWTLYLHLIPKLVPAPVWVLAIISIVLISWRGRYKRHLVYLLWFVWAYVAISYTSIKSNRYAFFLIPPIYLFACSIVDEIKIRVKGIRASTLLLVCACLVQCGLAYRVHGPLLGGFEEAARFIVQNWKGQTVVVSMYSHGNFTFNVRKLDPSGRVTVLRAEKVIKSLFLPPEKWRKDYLYEALRDLGAKYLVVESVDWSFMPELARLKSALDGNKFALRKRIPVTGNMRRYQGASILVYEFLEEVDLSREIIEMPIPKMHKKLRIQLK